MPQCVTITLVEPLIGHSEPIREIKLREPTFRDLMEIGDPQEYIRTAEGHVVPTTNWGAVGQYVSRCVPENISLLIETLSLQDGLKLSETMLGFFTEARLANFRIAESRGNSPSI